MDIAIVSPSPKPFAMGGIEKLMMGLYSKFDEITDHRVELIKVPTAEHDFWSLVDSYYAFYTLDLSHFDMVISCKYPAWMVRHRNHMVYMAHHLRGLFDTYHLMNLPKQLSKTSYGEINKILDYVRDERNLTTDIDPLFEFLHNVKREAGSFPEDLFKFPGPLIREVIHFLDKSALHPSRISRYNAISKTVKKRSDYFPAGTNVDVIYPPTSLGNLKGREYNYFLIVGRLDSAKRVSIVIEAMKKVKTEIKLLIAGSGPDEDALKKKARGDERVQFLGYINTKQLVTLYADALAVIYIPYDEDYGLVTIEAMHCGKPVVTCKDSGGTTEFVIHNQTGLIAECNVESLASQLQILANDIELAKKLGGNGRRMVEEITWENCISKLVSKANMKLKKKMIVLSTYPVFPRQHGGQLRIFNLYSNLQQDYDITIISLTKESSGYNKRIGMLQEICIPMTAEHIQKEWEIEKNVGIPITDIVMPQLSYLTPEFHDIVKKQAKHADILVSCQPYVFHLLRDYYQKKQLIYDSQNVEYDLKKSMLPDNKFSKKLLHQLYEVEKEACSKSDKIFACSKEDRERLKDLYNIHNENIFLVPNGVDTSRNAFVSYEERQENKRKLGIEQEKIVVFIGSWHKPNLEAVEEILKIAVRVPAVKFFILGGQCLAFKGRKVAPNVVFVGVVDEKLKIFLYSISDLAINPMTIGSGTNLKIAEYMAVGLPVISTNIGIRGYDLADGREVRVSSIEAFSQSIFDVLGNARDNYRLAENANKYVSENFSWGKIANRLKDIIIN